MSYLELQITMNAFQRTINVHTSGHEAKDSFQCFKYEGVSGLLWNLIEPCANMTAELSRDAVGQNLSTRTTVSVFRSIALAVKHGETQYNYQQPHDTTCSTDHV